MTQSKRHILFPKHQQKIQTISCPVNTLGYNCNLLYFYTFRDCDCNVHVTFTYNRITWNPPQQHSRSCSVASEMSQSSNASFFFSLKRWGQDAKLSTLQSSTVSRCTSLLGHGLTGHTGCNSTGQDPTNTYCFLCKMASPNGFPLLYVLLLLSSS